MDYIYLVIGLLGIGLGITLASVLGKKPGKELWNGLHTNEALFMIAARLVEGAETYIKGEKQGKSRYELVKELLEAEIVKAGLNPDNKLISMAIEWGVSKLKEKESREGTLPTSVEHGVLPNS